MLDLRDFLMRKLLKYKLLLISLIIISGCATDKKVTDTTYFGGKIINPKSKHVFFYKNNQLLDSTELNRKNKFLFKFDSLKVGLYTFKHGTEIQFLFLEPSDSLLLRLNYWDFDESLVFSGKGAEKNNLLINIFLQNEREDKFILKHYTLNDSLFDIKIDSLLQLKRLLFKQHIEEVVEVNPLFEEYINTAIYYPLYKKKEAYPYLNKKVLKLEKYPKISPTFYKYRKDINFKNEELQDFYAYYGYIRDYLKHIAYEKEIINTGTHIKVNFIEATSNHLYLEKLKNRFLNEGMWNVLLDDKIPQSEKKRAEKIFFASCKDETIKNNISNLIKASDASKKGDLLPILQVYDKNDKKITLSDQTKGSNTVIYFWPKGLQQIENLAKRVNYLENQHPDIKFVGIDAKNIDYNWKSYVKVHKFNANNQYRLDKNSADNDWIHIDYSRTILVDKNGIVQNSFTHLLNPRFEQQLRKLKKE